MELANIGIAALLAGSVACAIIAVASDKAIDSIRREPFHRSGDSLLIYMKGCSVAAAFCFAAAAALYYFLK